MPDASRFDAPRFDVVALGNAIVDVLSPADDAFLSAQGLDKGAMGLVDDARSRALYAAMAPGVESSGGSAGNTVAGVASFGGRAAYIGKVAGDQLGGVFAHDLQAGGVHFATPPLTGGLETGRCMVNVTPDGQRTMSTYLGAASQLTAADVDVDVVQAGAVVYLEGYLFDPPPAREAFGVAARAAREAGRIVAITLSDAFVVGRWRAELLDFLPQVDLVFANEVEAMALFETSDFAAAVDALAGRVRMAAVTRGAEGSVVRYDGEHAEVPAAPVGEVVDTTGAGDQYAAGFLFGLARGRPLEACAALGHLAAAEVIGHYGPRPQTPLADLARAQGLI